MKDLEEDTEGLEAACDKIANIERSPQAWSDVEPSNKIEKAMLILRNCANAGIKCVIYCPYVHPLHIMAGHIHKVYGDCRQVFWLTGQQSKEGEKEASLLAFRRSPDNAAIMLAVPKTGGLGINLTEAACCIFLSLSWNPQVDMQALCCCWRTGISDLICFSGPCVLTNCIGQTRRVNVFRLMLSNDVEQHVTKLQRKKIALQEAFDESVRSRSTLIR